MRKLDTIVSVICALSSVAAIVTATGPLDALIATTTGLAAFSFCSFGNASIEVSGSVRRVRR